MDRYRNTYHNSSDNDSGGTWVYINGELYHAGVKGMHWYKHLPGTDWWKKVGKTAKDVWGSNREIGKSKLESAVSTAKTVGKMVGGRVHGYLYNESRYYKNKVKNAVSNAKTAIGKGTSKLWNSTKGYAEDKINKLKENARNSYEAARNLVTNIMKSYQSSANSNYSKNFISGNDNLNSLRNFVSKEYRDACSAYSNAKIRGTFGNTVNSFIQTTQYNIASGCARFLNAIGMDDEVASFLNKFQKRSQPKKK